MAAAQGLGGVLSEAFVGLECVSGSDYEKKRWGSCTIAPGGDQHDKYSPRQSVVFIQHMMFEAFVVIVGQKHVTTEVREAAQRSPDSVGHDCEDPGLSSASLQADKQLTVFLQRLLPAPCWRLPPLLSLCL